MLLAVPDADPHDALSTLAKQSARESIFVRFCTGTLTRETMKVAMNQEPSMGVRAFPPRQGEESKKCRYLRRYRVCSNDNDSLRKPEGETHVNQTNCGP